MSDERRNSSRFSTGRVSYLRLNDYYFPLVDISDDGFFAECSDGSLSIGDVVDIEIHISDRHGIATFNTETEILRVGGRFIAGKWDLELNRATDCVKTYFDNRHAQVA